MSYEEFINVLQSLRFSDVEIVNDDEIRQFAFFHAGKSKDLVNEFDGVDVSTLAAVVALAVKMAINANAFDIPQLNEYQKGKIPVKFSLN